MKTSFFLLIFFSFNVLSQNFDPSQKVEIRDAKSLIKHITFGAESEGSDVRTLLDIGFFRLGDLIDTSILHNHFDYLYKIANSISKSEKLLSNKELKYIKKINSKGFFESNQNKIKFMSLLIFLIEKDQIKVPKNDLPKFWTSPEFLEQDDFSSYLKAKDIITETLDSKKSLNIIKFKKQTLDKIANIMEEQEIDDRLYYRFRPYEKRLNLISEITKDHDSWEVLFKPKDSLDEFFKSLTDFQELTGKKVGHVRVVIPLKKKFSNSATHGYIRHLSSKILLRSLKLKTGLNLASYNTFPQATSSLDTKGIIKVDGNDRSWSNPNNLSIEIRAGTKNYNFLKELLITIIEDAQIQKYEKFINFPESTVSYIAKRTKIIEAAYKKNGITNRKGRDVWLINTPLTWNFNDDFWKDYLGYEDVNTLTKSANHYADLIEQSSNDYEIRTYISDWIKENKKILDKVTNSKKVNKILDSYYDCGINLQAE